MDSSENKTLSQDLQSNSSVPSTRGKRATSVWEWFSSSLGSIALHAVVLCLLIWAIGFDRDGRLRGERRADEVGIILSDSKASAEVEKYSEAGGESYRGRKVSEA